jgi:hypothetical protein
MEKPSKKSGSKVAAKAAGKAPIRSKAAAGLVRAGTSTKQPATQNVTRTGLVRQFPPIDVKPAPARPRHLSSAQIAAMLKIMKIA